MKLTKQDIKTMIDRYPVEYDTPKYLLFMLEMVNCGFEVDLKKAKTTVSKYITIEKGNQCYKVRFSNHRSNFRRELERDCDFYKTEEVIKKIKELELEPKSRVFIKNKTRTKQQGR